MLKCLSKNRSDTKKTTSKSNCYRKRLPVLKQSTQAFCYFTPLMRTDTKNVRVECSLNEVLRSVANLLVIQTISLHHAM